MSKPFLIIQLRPEDETADNEFEAIKHYGGMNDAEVRRVRAEQSGLPRVNLNDYAAIIVGGSPFNISDEEPDKSPVQRKLEGQFFELFEELVREDFPFLGCCSGNGLIGAYCGASISRRFGEPVGGADISLTSQGREDPLLKGFPSRFRALLGHKEACDDVPPGCVLLATGDACPVQMFRLGENIYATQFHPEGDAAGFAVRIRVYKDYGYFPPETAQALSAAVKNERVNESQEILRRFVARYRQR